MEPTPIWALRAGRPEHTPEAELVLVDTAGDTATLTLDDGERISFNVTELRAALAA